MPLFRFQTKLFLAIALVVAGALIAVHLVTQSRVRAVYGQLFEERFTAQIDSFLGMQRVRLEGIAEWCSEAAKSPATVKVLKSNVRGDAIERFREEFGQSGFKPGAKRPPGRNGPTILNGRNSGERNGPQTAGGSRTRPSMVALVDLEGNVVPVFGGVVRDGRESGKIRMKKLGESLPESGDVSRQEFGYLSVGDDSSELREVVATQVIDPDTGEVLGSMVVGLPSTGLSGRALNRFSGDDEGAKILSGTLFDGEMYSESIPKGKRKDVANRIQETLDQVGDGGASDVEIEGQPYRMQFRALNPGSAFPVAYNVSLFPLSELHEELASMRNRALVFGVVALLMAFAVAFLLARRISVPINELAAGTEEVAKGDYSVRVDVRSRDEVGALASSFNEMAEGLSQREKFRSILSKVVDEQVARELVEGELDLGGEEKQATVLFCDIRDFTSITEGMAPQDVVEMVNGHMTAMTSIIHRCNGVVDKFVGDLVMAVFGVPKSYGDDARNGVLCALEMIKERERLNLASDAPIEIGIGLATGTVLAGKMGAEDRLDYTVLGERVNLASRLCSAAGAGEVIADQNTIAVLDGSVSSEPLEPLKLKGFSERIPAFKLEGEALELT